MSEKKKTLVTPKARAAFVSLFKARGFNGSEPKYSVSLIFDKKAQETREFLAMKQAVEAAAKERWPKPPPGQPIRSPFRDCSEKSHLGYPPGLFITVSSKQRPNVVDANREDITDETEIYSGIFARASLSVYAYERNGNRGVAFGLNNFQKLADGEPMNGRSSAQDDFDPVDPADLEGDPDDYFSTAA